MLTNVFLRYKMLPKRQKHLTLSILLASGAIVVLLCIFNIDDDPTILGPSIAPEKVRHLTFYTELTAILPSTFCSVMVYVLFIVLRCLFSHIKSYAIS